MLPKNKRIIDRALLDSFHDKSCIIAKGCLGQVVAHHVKSVGSGGNDVIENLIALCSLHHRQIHDLGQYTFFIKYGIKR